MTFELTIALRYLRSKKQDSFIKVISLFSLIGIMLGVATLIVVMSVMNGFDTQLRERILGINGHLTVSERYGALEINEKLLDDFKSLPEIKTVTPLVQGQGLIAIKGLSSGTFIRGVEDLSPDTLLGKSIDKGDVSKFSDKDIAIGSGIAQKYQLKIGDKLRLISPELRQTALGALPRQASFTVSHIFTIGMYEYDNNFVFLPLNMAQAFLNLGDKISGYELFIDDPDKVYEAQRALYLTIDPIKYVISNWQTSSPFFDSLAVERNVMFIILTMIIIVAVFNIISSMIMLVKDKTHDIAILRTIGTTRAQIWRIFMITGSAIGFIGALLGFILGLIITHNLEKIRGIIEFFTGQELFSAEVYYLTQLPSELVWSQVIRILIMAFVLTILATLFPAWRASKLNPVEALRHG